MSPDEKTVRLESRLLGEGFTMFWNVVLLNSSMTLGARMVHATLCHYARQADSAYPGQPKLAALLGISERSLRDYLRELEEVGLLETKRRRNTSNLYVLLDPSPDYMSKLESAKSAGAGSGAAESAGPEAAESAGPEAAKSADKEYAVGEVEAGEGETALGDESPGTLPGLEPPAPAKTAKQLEHERLDALVQGVWDSYFELFGETLGVKTLTPARAGMIRKGLSATGGDVELLKRAFLGLKSFRASHPQGSKETSIDVVFKTRPGGSNLTDQIEWWAGQAGDVKVDPLAHVPAHEKHIVRERIHSANRYIRDDQRLPEAVREQGKTDAEWLAKNYSLAGTLQDGDTIQWRKIG